MASKFKFVVTLKGSDFDDDSKANYEVVAMLRKLADRLEFHNGLDNTDGIKIHSVSGTPAGKVTVK